MDARYITKCGTVIGLDGSRSVHVVEHGPSFGFDWHMEYNVVRCGGSHRDHVNVDVVRLAPDYTPFPSYVAPISALPEIVRAELLSC